MGQSTQRFFAGFLMFLVFMGFSNPARAQEPNVPSAQTLQGLVDLMENPEKREAFVKDLKNLIETKKTVESKDGKQAAGTDRKDKEQLVIVRYAFDQFENLSRDLRNSAAATIHAAGRIPQTIGDIGTFFGHQENRTRLITLSLITSGAILIALLAGLLLRPAVQTVTGKMKDFPARLFWGIVRVVLTATPYACLLFFFTCSAESFHLCQKGQICWSFSLPCFFFTARPWLHSGFCSLPTKAIFACSPLRMKTQPISRFGQEDSHSILSSISWQPVSFSGQIQPQHCIRRSVPFFSWDFPSC